MSDRRVPGLAIPRLDLYVPNDWDRFELALEQTPPSLNVVGGTSHWRRWAELKKAWQTDFEGLLMAQRLRREHYVRAVAGAIMRFPVIRRRDSGNLGAVVEKALGDALVNGSFIKDDTADRYAFLGVEFEDDRGPARTTVVLYLSTH